MLARLSKNVVCVRNIPSNLIEEAFFILKSGETQGDIKNNNTRNSIIMSEVNEMIQECSAKIKVEKEMERKNEIEAKMKLQKIKMRTFWSVAIITIGCLMIAIWK